MPVGITRRPYGCGYAPRLDADIPRGHTNGIPMAFLTTLAKTARIVVVIGAMLVGVMLIGIAAARAEITIATVGPMTAAKAWMGEQYKWGVELAVAEINDRGGVLGQKLRLVIGDDACDAAQAVSVAQKLVNDGIVFVAGHYCSHASIPASKIYEEADIVMISPSSTSPILTDEGGANVFRVCGRDDEQGLIAGDYLADHWRDAQIAILNDQSTYGQGLAAETVKQLHARGVSEALNLSYAPDQIDYSPLISVLQEANIDVIYVGGYSAEVGLILRQARNQGFDAQLISGDAVVTEDFWLTAGAAAEGALMTFFPDARETQAAAPTVAQFRARGFEPEGYTLYAYAAVQVWAEAVARAATLDPQAVIAALQTGTFNEVVPENRTGR